jgi:hypothetical protein
VKGHASRVLSGGQSNTLGRDLTHLSSHNTVEFCWSRNYNTKYFNQSINPIYLIWPWPNQSCSTNFCLRNAPSTINNTNNTKYLRMTCENAQIWMHLATETELYLRFLHRSAIISGVSVCSIRATLYPLATRLAAL